MRFFVVTFSALSAGISFAFWQGGDRWAMWNAGSFVYFSLMVFVWIFESEAE